MPFPTLCSRKKNHHSVANYEDGTSQHHSAGLTSTSTRCACKCTHTLANTRRSGNRACLMRNYCVYVTLRHVMRNASKLQTTPTRTWRSSIEASTKNISQAIVRVSCMSYCLVPFNNSRAYRLPLLLILKKCIKS